MLTVSYINPSGLFSYGLSDSIMFPQNSLIHMMGVNEDRGGCSNAAGKTGLLNTICEVYYGENPTRVSGAGAVNRVWDHGCAGRSEFVSWENVFYRITYCRDWKDDLYANDCGISYRGTDLFFEAWDGERWVDRRGASMTETRKAIIKAVGLSYSRFLAISYLSHRVGVKFLRGTNKERDDILSGITGVEEWDSITSKCRMASKGIDGEIVELRRDQLTKQGALEVLETSERTLKEQDWGEAIRLREGELSSFGKQRDDLNAKVLEVSGTIEQMQQSTTRTYDEDSRIRQIDTEVSQLRTQADTLARTRITVDDFGITVMEGERHSYYIEMTKIQGAILNLEGETTLAAMENCPTCGSKITKAKKDKIQKKLKKLEKELEVPKSLMEETDVKLAEARTRQEEQRVAKEQQRDTQIEELNERVRLLGIERSQVEAASLKLQEELVALKKSMSDLEVAISRVDANIKLTQANLEIAQGKAQELQVLESKLYNTREELNTLESKITECEGQVAVYKWLISNIPYIKLHKLSVSMVVLSERVNQYLADMGNSIRVGISSFAEKKSTKGAADATGTLKSEIKVEVTDGVKNIDPRLYSDGEAGALSSALIRALHDLAMQFGHGCNLKLLDEVFSFIDHDNSQLMASSFSNGQGTTIVTDNSGRASGLMDFDTVWVARKRNGKTTLEVSNGS